MSNSALGTSVALVAPSLEEAFYGLAGDVARAIEPNSEADPLAILIQFMAVVGNVVGRGPHFLVEDTPHYLNLSVLLVGDTSKSRKGTSWGHVRRIFNSPQLSDPDWENRIRRGLSTGEGLINAVRDARGKDPGVRDKRLLIQESEFAFPLEAMKREGNTLSQVLRDAWDGGTSLSTLTKKSPLKATNAHITVIGHITGTELRRRSDRTELANGFANRFLIVLVRRSKLLSLGGRLSDEQLAPFLRRIKASLEFGRTAGRMQFDAEAVRLWDRIYAELADPRPGLIADITARAEAQIIRLACIYALLDQSNEVRREHLWAAWALWRHCEASAEFLFEQLESSPIAQHLLIELRRHGPAGMTRTEVRDFFSHHQSERLDDALSLLKRLGLAHSHQEPSGGRPATRWVATKATKPSNGSREPVQASEPVTVGSGASDA